LVYGDSCEHTPIKQGHSPRAEPGTDPEGSPNFLTREKEKGTDLFSEPVMMRSDPDLVDPVGGKSRSENKSVPFSFCDKGDNKRVFEVQR